MFATPWAKRTGDFSIFELAKVGIQNERKNYLFKEEAFGVKP